MTTSLHDRPLKAHRLLLAALAAGLLLAALFTGAQVASAQSGVTWQSGNYCVQDFEPGATCAANDVRIASISPALSDVCLLVGDQATAFFTLDIETGAQTRYDIGLFIATDGSPTGALSGDLCYHDFLQPPDVLNSDGTPLNPLGVGPFANYDGDTCADTKQSSNAFYTTQVAVTIPCVDNDNDGIIDPISTCTSWDNNSNTTCSNVTQAFPGTPSKCNCETIPTNVKIYRGLDGGDLPETYGTEFAPSGTYPEGGARHAIQDPTSDGTPDSIGSTIAIWMGPSVDYAWTNPADETSSGGFPSADALGDDGNNIDDENGVAFVGPWSPGTPNGGRIDVSVSASAVGECTAGNDCIVSLWLDWDNSGDFDNALFSVGGERYDFTLTNGTGTAYQLTFDTPATWDSGLAARVRLYDNAPGSVPISPVGLAVNGEVEDYRVAIGPLAVVLSDFSAVCQVETPLISWETVSEIETLGFNLLRGATPDGWDTQLNSSLIPAQFPGGSAGGAYQWLDDTAPAGVTHYYWLQDISLSGAASEHGPISVMCIAPTAVRLDGLDASSPAAAAVPWWTAALALSATLGVAVAARRRIKA